MPASRAQRRSTHACYREAWTVSPTLVKDVTCEVRVRGRGGLEHSWSGLFLRPRSGTEQMLSHGTADVVLEACTDFWDGADIYPLSGSDRWVRRRGPVARAVGSGVGRPGTARLTAASFPGRKKVLDFYQRACLSGYCSAFAYKPMSCSVTTDGFVLFILCKPQPISRST